MRMFSVVSLPPVTQGEKSIWKELGSNPCPIALQVLSVVSGPRLIIICLTNKSFFILDTKSLSGCGPESGSCLKDEFGRFFNLGDFNSTLTWSSNEELTLKYSTRDSASSSDRNSTVIRFRCGPMRNETHVVFIERRSGITFLDVFTSLVRPLII